ncbi:MAG TPA: DUF3105 domain-containing protein [Planctomycetota bacterium]|nr:DUF3105 domain-containing protein [Planctomycetota bacterium]
MWRILVLASLAVIIPACGGSGSSGGGSSGGGVMSFSDPGIETFPDEGNAHVPVGTDIAYNTDPPTSGSHYPDPQPGGYYTTPIAPGFLVHSLEHGAVVIYYDSAHVAASDLTKLQNLAAAHPGNFGQVVVVPRTDAAFPIILTAWTHRLRLTVYEQSRIDGFVALFLGNGPEAPPMP